MTVIEPGVSARPESPRQGRTEVIERDGVEAEELFRAGSAARPVGCALQVPGIGGRISDPGKSSGTVPPTESWSELGVAVVSNVKV